MSDRVTRRDALKVLGAVPVAAAVGALPDMLQQVPVKSHVTPTAPAHPSKATPPSTAPAAPRFFTAHEFATVALLSDYVIPADHRSGSATDAQVPEHIDFLLSDQGTSESSRVAMRGGLAWLDTECRRRFSKSFLKASDAQRRQVLDDIAWPKKAPAGMGYGVAFFNRFRDMTAASFFSTAMGWKDLQYIGNTFNPNWNGCPDAANEKLGVSQDVMNTRVPVERP